MRTRVERRTVNLSAYPDLVIIYLGMRVNRITGIKTQAVSFSIGTASAAPGQKSTGYLEVPGGVDAATNIPSSSSMAKSAVLS
jgi:hypothetical protein